MSEKWRVKRSDGSIYGPVDTETLKKWVQEARIGAGDHILPEGGNNWQPCRYVSQFADMFPKETVSAGSQKKSSKKPIIAVVIILLVAFGGYFLFKSGVIGSIASKISEVTKAEKTVEETISPESVAGKTKPKAARRKSDPALNAKLFEAIKSEDIHKIRELIDKGADVNAKDQYKRSALWCALKNPFFRRFNLDQKTKEAKESFRKSKEITLLLIEKGADVNVKETEYEKTVLHGAASCGQKDIVKAAIDKGADINARIRWGGETPLHYAFFNAGRDDDDARLEIVKLLVDSGANANIKTKEGQTPIKLAERCGMKACANYMRKHGKKGPVVQVAKTEYTHITSAAVANRLDAIKYLLKKGVDINQAGEDGTALHIAVRKKYTDIVKFLVENGADINKKNRDGMTPLVIAQSKDLMDIMKLLINKGADVNVKDPWSRSTPLHHAVSKGDREMVELLLSKGAETKVKTKHGGTPFEFAMDRYDRDIIKLLIKSGADVNAEVRVGFPLLVALNKEDPEMAKLLISKGADVNITSNSDNSKIRPLHHAVMGGHKDLVKLMLEKGADVNAKDSAGRTAMGYARYTNAKVRNEITALLRKHGAK